MQNNKIQQLKALKEKFKAMRPKEREQVSVNFLKVKLGVHQPEEFDQVIAFLDHYPLDINPENLDSMMNYLHSTSHSLPEFIAMEDSMSNIQEALDREGLMPYNADEADTMKDGVKPFDSQSLEVDTLRDNLKPFNK